MKISNIYIGGWFQRTMLQLSEIYDFLRECKSQLNLEQEKLNEYHKQLELGNIDYGVAGVEYVEFTTALNIRVKIFEDGLITLNNHEVTEETFFADIAHLTDYYENRLSPTLRILKPFILILLSVIKQVMWRVLTYFQELTKVNILNLKIKNTML